MFREHNKGADALASRAINERRSTIVKNLRLERPVRAIQCYFDGGHKDGATSAGVVLDVSYEDVTGSDIRHNKWINIFRMAFFIGENDVSDSMAGELFGASQAILAAFSLVHAGEILVENGEVQWQELGLTLNLFIGKIS